MTNDEYTPTTNEVRRDYSDGSMHDGLTFERAPEFDRWLAAHDAEVRAADAEEIARLERQLAKREEMRAAATERQRALAQQIEAVRAYVDSLTERIADGGYITQMADVESRLLTILAAVSPVTPESEK